jgi:hypothetical protein
MNSSDSAPAEALSDTASTEVAACKPTSANRGGQRTLPYPIHNPMKTEKLENIHCAINYLVRQYEDNLPLASAETPLPSILSLVSEYQEVLDRQESIASNLGVPLLGTTLIRRFERLFDGPPKILKNHGKYGNTVTWLDVLELARNKPRQFMLIQLSDGTRVCQLYIKQCRVQITEEDFMLIDGGIAQKLVPPHLILEDEEKELDTLEGLNNTLDTIRNHAEQGKSYYIPKISMLTQALSCPTYTRAQSSH